MTEIKRFFQKITFSTTSIAPLVVFRILFGIMMFFSTLRFINKGWVKDLYVLPKYHFTYYGFEWIKPFSENGMTILFIVLLILSILISIGFLYRFSIITFFLIFTYIELIDKTNYLNHYYFISVISFILIFLPANKYFSIDTFTGLVKSKDKISSWNINIIKFQIGIVYLFSGIAKLNYNWLIEAQPLSNWLKHQTDLPIIGGIMEYTETAFLFSWAGCLFDLFIVFILLNHRFRIYGYFLVIFFHCITSAMFPIGVFPFVMIISTLIFFSENFHIKVIRLIKVVFNSKYLSFTRTYKVKSSNNEKSKKTPPIKIQTFFIVFFITIQLLLPLRHVLYNGNLFWTEQGFRFSWRVMLIEKVGYAQFYIHDQKGRKKLIDNKKFLTGQQEKMMTTQADMILQFAHHLRDTYSDTNIVEKNGEIIHLDSPKVSAEVYVSLFNKGSRLFIDSSVNLSKIKRGFHEKNWIINYH